MIVKTVSYTDKAAPEKLTESLRKTGFAVLNNHPISKSLINETYKQWENFFNLETKNQYLYDKDTQDGFFPFGTENAKGNKAKDLKEFYHIYSWGKYPKEINNSTLELYEKIIILTKNILQWIQDQSPSEVRSLFSIPLPKMIEKSQNHLLRILHYPPLNGDEQKGAIRGAAHEDINLITLLVAGTQPGLQVQDINGTWHDVSCDIGSIAINTGDMLSEASNGYFPSTTHRVINPNKQIKNKSRYSMPLFLHPRDDVILSEKYTAGSYLKERIKEIGLRSK